MNIEQWALDKFIEYVNNPRNNDHAIDAVASAIHEFGFRVPLVAKSDGSLIDGHLRLKAAKKLNLETVPVILADDMTEAQIKAFRISVNRMADLADWDMDALKVELEALEEFDFDIDLLGFDDDFMEELDLGIDEVEGLTDEDDVPEVPESPVSVRGDVWVLGSHRVMCGDSTSIDDVEKLMDGNKADMVFTDPPYGISIVSGSKIGGDAAFGSKGAGTICGNNIIKANEYAPVAGDDSIDVAIEAIQVIKTLGAKVEIIWGGNYYANSLENSSCWIVWDKQNSGNFADCELAWTNQDTAVRQFSHMWNGMIKASEHGEKRVHPTQKPIALAEWCFDNYAEECKTVLDLFGGSGFTLMACETRNKTGFIMELSENYIDVIIKRWQEYTGKDAVHAESGKTFNELIDGN